MCYCMQLFPSGTPPGAGVEYEKKIDGGGGGHMPKYP